MSEAPLISRRCGNRPRHPGAARTRERFGDWRASLIGHGGTS
jgi:hypothetical protein